MATLIIGSTTLVTDLVMAFEHGDPDYVRLVTEDGPGRDDGIVYESHPEPAALVTMFRSHAVDVVINAADPYAADVSAAVTAACEVAGLPLLRAVPPPFDGVAGSERWNWVASFDAAEREASRYPGDVMLALEPLRLAERLGDLGGRSALSHRRRTSMDPRIPGWVREPDATRYGLRGAISVLAAGNVRLLVAADSGDTGVRSFLEAADQLGIEVVMVRRPEPASDQRRNGPSEPVVTDALSALAWLSDVRRHSAHRGR
ncbi:precorrin-6A/cobalt-precorrin-6A reductase [Jiangella sp. DSM 45060]|uniref:precorrin-6A/cobalt-precorrin-6A reductase n=1 Tax=Jiangella sp. DSM 45060 TaxID=1798224 RepID=UPI00087A0FA1|nr:precorrin-6A/cobalt-precorrin-6A reductase [Jiangella sp. DSM 45060]SDT15115.1 precorrin-6A/cobalt-precorrin-6A reductase [Jiangella sp. DSM 45060]